MKVCAGFKRRNICAETLDFILSELQFLCVWFQVIDLTEYNVGGKFSTNSDFTVSLLS